MVKVKDTLDNFLFRKIANDLDYITWAKAYEIPSYITDNLNPKKPLRDYQQSALKHFIYLYEHDRPAAKHLLFNMATGAGKTLVMAGCVLYLYQKGYRNFLFLVHQIQIKEQALTNFTNYKFSKYLFNPDGIKLNGQQVDIKLIDNIYESSSYAINFMFLSTALLYSRLKEDKEDSITAADFKTDNMVIIADEAHRLNVDTRSKSKRSVKNLVDDLLNWESAVMSAVQSRPENLLLEFTATVDLAQEAIHEKYTDKIVYRYDFFEFNKARYSKNVKFLYNQEVHTEDQKRLLIVNAVALSEYRRLLAERTMGVQIKPVILIKSARIAKSAEDRQFFDDVIASLRPDDLERLKEIGQQNKDREHEILSDMFSWIKRLDNGLVNPRDPTGLTTFVAEIRRSFDHENTLVYNSKKKERADLLVHLDSPRNTIRAIFSVNALTEGWDVLSLYDIIHFDISDSKTVSQQDIQLVGRGARYCPYELPASYRLDDDSSLRLLDARPYGNLEYDIDRRKFDNDPNETGRVLETLVYHLVETGSFHDSLKRELLGEGIINEGAEIKTIRLKQQFLASQTYKSGFVLVNKKEKRTKTQADELDTTFNRTIKAPAYKLKVADLSDAEQNQIIASQKIDTIHIIPKYFSRPIIRKALVSAENNFFRFNNLKHHLVELQTIDELIDKLLPQFQIQYIYEQGNEIDNLTPKKKLQLLIGVILPEVRRAIDLSLPAETGTNVFRPVSLSQMFSQERDVHLMSFPEEDPKTGKKTFKSRNERAQPQSNHNDPELRYDVKSADWYAYDENYGTSEEKRFVRFMASQIDNLRAKYETAEIYLIRNGLEYQLFNPLDGRRFSPDYILLINDVKAGKMYYQCLIEPKGGHLLEHDAWKEQALISLADNSRIVFDSDSDDKSNYRKYLEEVRKRGYQEIKCLGLKFYNSDTRGEEEFALEVEDKLL